MFTTYMIIRRKQAFSVIYINDLLWVGVATFVRTLPRLKKRTIWNWSGSVNILLGL